MGLQLPAARLVRPLRWGFTLIELLVVISIIAVLASMLMGAISMVRTAALNGKCGSNQRSLCVAMQTYATDFEGALPYREINTEWFETAVDYLESQYQAQYQKNRRDVFHCPFADREITNPWTFFHRFTSHYGMNEHIRVSWNQGGWWNNSQPPLQVASLPPNLVMMTDNRPWIYQGMVYFEGSVDYTSTGGPWPVSLNNAITGAAPIRMHGRAINLVCIDGHVERVSATWDPAVMNPRFRTSASKL